MASSLGALDEHLCVLGEGKEELAQLRRRRLAAALRALADALGNARQRRFVQAGRTLVCGYGDSQKRAARADGAGRAPACRASRKSGCGR